MSEKNIIVYVETKRAGDRSALLERPRLEAYLSKEEVDKLWKILKEMGFS